MNNINDIKISIIVPVYNTEKYIEKCVDSILNQTHKNLEIILVDDGSPDNCGKICDNYEKKDNRVKVIHKKNSGSASSKNMAINIATGDYIGFVDSDDYIEADMFEYLLNNSISFNADVVRCGFFWDIDGGIYPQGSGIVKKVNDYNDKIIDLMKDGVISGIACNKLYKKNILEGVYFPEGIKYSEDFMFNYKVFKNSNIIVYADENKYHYLRRNGSVLMEGLTESRFDEINIIKEIVENEKNNNITYRYCVKRLVEWEMMFISRIIREKRCIDKYKDLRKDVLKYTKNVFFDGIYSNIFKLRFLLFMVFPYIYKLVIKYIF